MTAKPDLTLYHAPHTRSVRVRWLLEEMGLPYECALVKSDTRPFGDEAFAKVNPLRKVPALRDGEDLMLESTAMVEYLLARYGADSPLALRPDEAEFGRYLQFVHFSEASMAMPVNLLLAHKMLLPEEHRNPQLAGWAQAETDKLLAFLGDYGLKDREYLAGGRFTAADICVGYMLYLLKITRSMKNAPGNLNAYFKRITARESWKAASAAETADA